MHLTSLRDQPNTQREYETIFIVTPEADSEKIHQINERVRKIVENDAGKILRVENWGKRKLAYEIRKNSRGIYLYWRYLSNPELIQEIERNLRMLDPVIRYMTVKITEDIDPGARPSDMDDEAFIQASQTIPDEEDIAMGRDRGEDEGEQKADAPKTEGDAPKAEGDAPKAEGDAAKAEEPKAEEPKAEEPKAEEPKTEGDAKPEPEAEAEAEKKEGE